jgi:hypothetical protein
VLYTHAGPEIGVASTKAYTAQLMMFYIFALKLAASMIDLTTLEGKDTPGKVALKTTFALSFGSILPRYFDVWVYAECMDAP